VRQDGWLDMRALEGVLYQHSEAILSLGHVCTYAIYDRSNIFAWQGLPREETCCFRILPRELAASSALACEPAIWHTDLWMHVMAYSKPPVSLLHRGLIRFFATRTSALQLAGAAWCKTD
jgi:hypothetical protein